MYTFTCSWIDVTISSPLWCPPSELKLKRSIDGAERRGFNPSTEPCRTSTDQKGAAVTGAELQHLDNNSNNKPSLEETVQVVTNRVKERRQELGLPDNIKVHVSPQLPPTPSTHTHTPLFLLMSTTSVCPGYVPFPDDNGEDQSAEVLALLWESARTTSKIYLSISHVFVRLHKSTLVPCSLFNSFSFAL